MSDSERLHAWSHLVLFLMLFMVTLAVLRFSTPTGLATGNQSITAQGVGDLKPFLTAVGLLMGMLVAVIFVIAHDFNSTPVQPQKAQQAPAQEHRSLAEINRELAKLRKILR